MAQLSWTKQAIMAGSLLALGTTAYWLEFKRKPENEAKEEQKKKLFQIKDVSVDGIVLQDGAGRTYGLRCTDASAKLCKPGDNSKWELTEPTKLRADDSNANSLLSSLNNLNVVDTIDLKDETAPKKAALLKEYGLDEASRGQHSMKKVELKAGGVSQLAYLGANHPIGDSLFALLETGGKIDDTKVYLVPTYFKANFDHDLTYWRDKKLMSIAAHEIERFKLEASHGAVSGVRQDGAWTLTAGASGEVSGDIEAIDGLLTAATYLTAKEFTADKKTEPKATAALRGARKLATLTIQPEKGQAKEQPSPVTLILFAKGVGTAPKANPQAPGAPAATGKIYATLSNTDPLYEVELSVKERLDKNLKDLRLAKLLTSMERFTAKRLEFSSTSLGDPIVLVNKDGKWVNETEKSDVSNERVQAFLDRVSGNRIKEFLAGAAIPDGQDTGTTVKIGDGGKGAPKRQLLFWVPKSAKDGRGKFYARDLLSARKEAFLVDAAVNEELPKQRDHFSQPPASAPGAPPALPAGHPAVPGMPGTAGTEGGAPGAPPAPGRPLVPAPPPPSGR